MSKSGVPGDARLLAKYIVSSSGDSDGYSSPSTEFTPSTARTSVNGFAGSQRRASVSTLASADASGGWFAATLPQPVLSTSKAGKRIAPGACERRATREGSRRRDLGSRSCRQLLPPRQSLPAYEKIDERAHLRRQVPRWQIECVDLPRRRQG